MRFIDLGEGFSDQSYQPCSPVSRRGNGTRKATVMGHRLFSQSCLVPVLRSFKVVLIDIASGLGTIEHCQGSDIH